MCRTPMGLANSVSSFVRLMEEVFRDMLYKDVVIYLDDILIFSRTLQEHLEKVERVLGRLKLVNMKLKRSKCDFFKEEVTFLGHTISKDGVRPDERKIEVVKNYPEPPDKHELKSWLGLINFFRKYVKGFSQIAHPLHELLRKDAKFVWTLECKKAFETLRDSLISGPILGLPDFEEEFRIYSDASGYGVGYVLQQIQEGEEVVIAYGGRSLTKAERGYAIMDLEALALVSAIKHFESYLFKHFLAFVDNTGVAHLLSQKKSKGRILRWIIYLQAFDFELVYKPGKTLGNADALSRNPAWKPMVATAKADERDAILWARFQEEDGAIKPLIDFLRTGDKGKLPRKGAISQSSAHRFEVDNEGVLWRLAKNEATDQTHRVLVVPVTQIRDILVDHHDSLMAGHFGIAKTFKGISARYWWVGMFNAIKQYCDSCEVCAKNKIDSHPTKAQLNPIQSNGIFQVISMDFKGPLTETKNGNKYILAFFDLFSKYCECVALPSTEAELVARCFYERIISRWGMPRSVHSDQGSNFVGKIMTELCEILGIKKTKTSPFHPEGNGQIERFNSTLGAALRRFVNPQTDNWDDILPAIVYAYNTSVHSTTGVSPYFILHGCLPLNPGDNLKPMSKHFQSCKEWLNLLSRTWTLPGS